MGGLVGRVQRQRKDFTKIPLFLQDCQLRVRFVFTRAAGMMAVIKLGDT
jgi:hypothetical protein